MPLSYCAGTCGRMISISAIPGGNPEALAHPETFAVHYVACTRCRKLWCDRCVGRACSCGAALVVPTRDDTLRSYDPVSRAAYRIGELELPVYRPPASDGEPAFLRVAVNDEQVAHKLDLVHRAKASAYRPDEAVRMLDEALGLDPSMPEVLAMRGWLHQMCGHPDEARRDFDAALRVAPPDWRYRKAVSEELDGKSRSD